MWTEDDVRGDVTVRVGAIVLRMRVRGWLDDTRTSYDTVAVSYADMLRDSLASEPFQRGILALFAELVRAQGDGPVADVGCGPGRPGGCCCSPSTQATAASSRPKATAAIR